MSLSVQMDGVYRIIGSVMETMTVVTMLMNNTVQATPRRHRVYYSVTAVTSQRVAKVSQYQSPTLNHFGYCFRCITIGPESS